MTRISEPAAVVPPRQLPQHARLKPDDVVRVGLVGVRGRPLRACLSSLGIAIGIGALIAIVGITAGSQAHINDQLDKVGTNLLTATAGQNLFGDRTELPAESVGMVNRIGPVQSVSAVGAVAGTTVHRSDKTDQRDGSGITVQATRLDLLDTIGGAVGKGSWLNAATARYPAVVLGSIAAQRLGIDTIGVSAYLSGRWFTVVGVLKTIPLAPEIDRSALIGWQAAKAFGFDGHPSTIYARTTNEMVNSVHDVLARTINPQQPSDVTVSRPSDALVAALAVKSTFTPMLVGLGGVALLVGGIGIANTMVISVLERRSEIGLRRALGASRGQIKLQFLTESVTLSAMGGVGGIALGLAISVGWAIRQHWPVTLPSEAVLAAVAAACCIGATAGLYPASRAARTPPTESLNAHG